MAPVVILPMAKRLPSEGSFPFCTEPAGGRVPTLRTRRNIVDEIVVLGSFRRSESDTYLARIIIHAPRVQPCAAP